VASDSDTLKKELHKLIKKVGEDIEAQRFNTCVSSLMEFLNSVKDEPMSTVSRIQFLTVLYPFAPHIAEELHLLLGGKQSLQQATWPKFDPKKIIETTVEFIVQINGKLRDRLELPVGVSEAEARKLVLGSDKIKTALGGSEIKRVIFVPNKLINIVV
jgi:leucyl-tRNA synthetase